MKLHKECHLPLKPDHTQQTEIARKTTNRISTPLSLDTLDLLPLYLIKQCINYRFWTATCRSLSMSKTNWAGQPCGTGRGSSRVARSTENCKPGTAILISAFRVKVVDMLPGWRVAELRNAFDCGSRSRSACPAHHHTFPGGSFLNTLTPIQYLVPVPPWKYLAISERSFMRGSLQIATSTQITGNNIAPVGSCTKLCPAPPLGRLASTGENIASGSLTLFPKGMPSLLVD